MTTTTKYPKWYDADISPTDVLKSIHIPHICFLSANAYGLKGKLPGGKHTWMSVFNGGFWTTYEVTDMETLNVQGGYPWHGKVDKQSRQIIVSDRDPSQKWFGSEPRLDYIGKYASQSVLTKAMNEYPKNGNFNLLTNNCSTFVSYMAWKLGEDYRAPYVGFKNKKYWEKLLDNQ